MTNITSTPVRDASERTHLATSSEPGPIVVFDDDPTGTQLAEDTDVVLDWSDDVLDRLTGSPFHLLTNSRALPATRAFAVTREACRQVVRHFPRAELILRGDSTLRAHLREEYEAVQEVAFRRSAPVLLLIPALPTAGRLTLDGTQVMERNGVRVPLHQTEYARDGHFAYSDARLIDWAHERSDGLFDRSRGVELRLKDMRAGGEEAVVAALDRCAASGIPAACVPDAETLADLEVISAGLKRAREAGIPVIARCAPAFASVHTGTLARQTSRSVRADRVLVVCGSYVTRTTQQLDALRTTHPGAFVELEIQPLLGFRREAELARVTEAARDSLAEHRLAIIATPRERSDVANDALIASYITQALATITRFLAHRFDLAIFKGGITAAVGIKDGLGSRAAKVEGPVSSGVALWRVEDGRRCVVFPGNVGTENSLSDLVDAALA